MERSPDLILPRSLARRLDDIERKAEALAEAVATVNYVVDAVAARLGAVEQLTSCVMACARERCAFKCPTEGGEHDAA